MSDMPYAIMRFAKRKRGAVSSMEAHNERKKEQYKSNPDIDMEKTVDNYHLIQPQHKYYAEIMKRSAMFARAVFCLSKR